jgi:hypothetical protein
MQYAEGHRIPHIRYTAAYADFYADVYMRILKLEFIYNLYAKL